MIEEGLPQRLNESGGSFRRLDSLCSVWFIAALSLLLLNDYYLKGAYHNWITEKLSDFAGLFVLSVFLMAVWPQRKVVIAWGAGITFLIWKSSLSQPAIDYWNALPLMRVDRTIDYTDAIATVMLPLAFSYRPSFRLPRLAGVIPLVVLAVTLFGILGTSRAVKQSYNPSIPPQYIFVESPESLMQRIKGEFGGKIRIADVSRINLGPPPPGQYDTSYYDQFSHLKFEDRNSRIFNVRFLILPESSGQRSVLALHGVVEYGSGAGHDDLLMLFQEYVIAKLKAGSN